MALEIEECEYEECFIGNFREMPRYLLYRYFLFFYTVCVYQFVKSRK